MRAKANSVCTSLAYTGQLKAKLRYDPLGRLHEVEGFVSGVTQGKQRFLYDGDALVAEYNAAGTMLKRYVHGPAAGADDPLAEYTGSSTAASARRNLYADARGSIVLSTTSTGGAGQINSYDGSEAEREADNMVYRASPKPVVSSIPVRCGCPSWG